MQRATYKNGKFMFTGEGQQLGLGFMIIILLFVASGDLSYFPTTSAIHFKVFELFHMAFSGVWWQTAFSLLYAVNGNRTYLFKGYQYLCFRKCFSFALPTFLSSVLLPLHYCFHFVSVDFCLVNAGFLEFETSRSTESTRLHWLHVVNERKSYFERIQKKL